MGIGSARFSLHKRAKKEESDLIGAKQKLCMANSHERYIAEIREISIMAFGIYNTEDADQRMAMRGFHAGPAKINLGLDVLGR